MRMPTRTRTLTLLGFAIATIGGAVLACVRSPWPAALVIRAAFDRDAVKTAAETARFAPLDGVSEQLDVPYRGGVTLDVFRPTGADGPLPTVVWIHGGAWISGSKSHVAPYLRILAAQGYTVVGLDYSVAPEKRYPVALRQLDRALAFLDTHAERFGIDPERFVLAGDSAGAQLSSQLATAISDPAYAAELGIRPGLTAQQVRGVILHCGIYEMSGLLRSTGIIGWGNRAALHAYIGGLGFASSPSLKQMSMMRRATASFPPTFISGGNSDPLTDAQAKPFAERLESLGVDVTRLFWPHDHAPALGHEYQFDLDRPEGLAALRLAIDFVRRHTV